MKPKLVKNWKVVLFRAWSIRAAVAAAFFGALEAALSVLNAEVLGIPPGTFAAISAMTSAAVIFLRVLQQQASAAADSEDGEQ